VHEPLAVPTAELFRHPGSRQHVVLAGPLPDVSLSTAALTPDDVRVDLVLEAQGSVVTVTGTAIGRWTGECRRCLETTSGTVEVELHEVFEPVPVEGETYPLGADHVDLEPVLREAFALALPLAPLCDEACAGPDPTAHPVTREGEVEGADMFDGDDAAPPRDPRWAALDALRFDR